MKNRFPTIRRQVRSTRPAAFTLLELMLALALTAVILVLMNMAIDLHLRSLDARRTQLEESQLARSVLRIIADDVRGVIQSYQQDVSSVEAMIQQAATSATAQVASSVQSATSSSESDTSSSNSQSSTSNAGSTGSSQQFGDGITSSRSSGATATNSSSNTPSSTSSSSGGSSTTMGTTKSSSSSTSTESQATADLSTVTVPELPGIYGNQYQLQIDVSRLPRVEQYQTNLSDNPLTEVTDIPSDVKTVTYYVQTPPAAAVSGATASASSLAMLTDPNANPSGLVRRELDRAVTSSAMATGNITGLENSGEILAPEVTGIEFRYFDGAEWLMEWDTSTEQMLPLAIQILMSVTTQNSRTQTAATAAGAVPNVRIYSIVVNLPTGGQSAASESASSTTSSDTSSTGSTSSSEAAP